jgi:hypothetical protein
MTDLVIGKSEPEENIMGLHLPDWKEQIFSSDVTLEDLLRKATEQP